MQLISSADNKFIKLASSLKLRKYREELGMFLVEGARFVDEVLAQPELIEVILVRADRAEEIDLNRLPVKKTVLVDPRLAKHFCSTENPQGIAAVVRKPDWSWSQTMAEEGLLLYLDRIADPGNLGSILRSCQALGVKGVLMSPGCVDLFNPKVVRSTMGAILHLPCFTAVGVDEVRALSQAGYSLFCTDTEQGQPYYDVDYRGEVLVILGSEAQGVDRELRNECGLGINIPIEPEVESLNVAAACAIIVAEARRQKSINKVWS